MMKCLKCVAFKAQAHMKTVMRNGKKLLMRVITILRHIASELSVLPNGQPIDDIM